MRSVAVVKKNLRRRSSSYSEEDVPPCRRRGGMCEGSSSLTEKNGGVFGAPKSEGGAISEAKKTGQRNEIRDDTAKQQQNNAERGKQKEDEDGKERNYGKEDKDGKEDNEGKEDGEEKGDLNEKHYGNRLKRPARKRGLSSIYMNPKDIQREAQRRANAQAAREEGEEDTQNHGLSQFTSLHSSKPVTVKDPHLEDYIAARLHKEKKIEPEEKPKPMDEIQKKEINLYQIPKHLQVKNTLAAETDKLNLAATITEFALPIEHKLRTMEETERAKRRLLKMSSEKGNDEEMDITSRAFGSRFVIND